MDFFILSGGIVHMLINKSCTDDWCFFYFCPYYWKYIVYFLEASNKLYNFLLFQAKALGRVLFDQVCKQLHLLEADYFGLEYQEPNGTKVSV